VSYMSGGVLSGVWYDNATAEGRKKRRHEPASGPKEGPQRRAHPHRPTRSRRPTGDALLRRALRRPGLDPDPTRSQGVPLRRPTPTPWHDYKRADTRSTAGGPAIHCYDVPRRCFAGFSKPGRNTMDVGWRQMRRRSFNDPPGNPGRLDLGSRDTEVAERFVGPKPRPGGWTNQLDDPTAATNQQRGTRRVRRGVLLGRQTGRLRQKNRDPLGQRAPTAMQPGPVQRRQRVRNLFPPDRSSKRLRAFSGTVPGYRTNTVNTAGISSRGPVSAKRLGHRPRRDLLGTGLATGPVDPIIRPDHPARRRKTGHRNVTISAS